MTIRTATEHDSLVLRDLERAANLVALADVFPPEGYPYASDAVAARWSTVLADPSRTTLVIEGLRLTLFGGHSDRQVSAWQGRMPSWVPRGGVTPRSTGRKPLIW